MTQTITTRSTPLARTDQGPDQIAQLLQAAIDKNISVEAMEKLVELHERVSARQAASEFAAAMAEFQAECPSIPKTSTATIPTNSGGSYSYKYAELDAIATVIQPIMHANGLSYSWDSDVVDGKLVCVCTVRHANGHSQPATFTCPIDDRSKGMSEPQKYAAALTYARRQALIQALGLTTTDPDPDGGGPPAAKILKPQVNVIADLIRDSGADLKRFLAYTGVEHIDEIDVDQYESAVSMLRRKMADKT